MAVFLTLKHSLPDLRGVLVQTDNTFVFSYINHQGGLRSCPLNKLTHQILLWAQDKLLTLRAIYIPGHQNQEADILRPGSWRLHLRWWSRYGGSSTRERRSPVNDTLSALLLPHVSSSPGGPWLLLYAFPSIALLSGVLEGVCRDGPRLLLVACSDRRVVL